VTGSSEITALNMIDIQTGYLIGDRLVRDGVAARAVNLKSLESCSETVHLIEAGLDLFARVSAGRFFENGPLVYMERAFPLGPEDDVLGSFLDKKKSVDDIKGVIPSLDLAFRLETWRRDELERTRREEQERREKEERRRQLTEKLGDGEGRREMAKIDFAEAVNAALAVGGAEYLDYRKAVNRNEFVVRFRLDGRRYECVCDNNMRIVDAGICLTNSETDEKGDTYFTLESFPAVIRQAIRERKLVVWRHAD
jgi:hypothetical protein